MAALQRWVLWSVVALVALQLFFAARIAAMAHLDPHSTAFMRSEIWRRTHQATPGQGPWSQQWVDAEHISVHLKRAVIASEDDGFAQHRGVDWSAMESAWSKNQKQAKRNGAERATERPLKIVGGSTITQQLAKNLLLSGERSLVRKGQEFILTLCLEALLDKRRILELYLNSVEWGDGVFGAEAAARRYFGVSAQQLNPEQAARLAVMLPAPKAFERRPQSAYLSRRTGTILARMASANLP
ncbi:monofunctional biosynthetic peptidoglycan transglycosylase [Hydrogenophaga soli]